MTLRRRLLLVYSIVVLLSVATVGVAMFELSRSRQIIRELQDWNRIVDRVEEFRAAFETETGQGPDREAFERLFPQQIRALTQDPPYLDVDRVRTVLGEVWLRYDEWIELEPAERRARIEMVSEPLENLSRVVQSELDKLNLEADRQDVRIRLLLAVVILLTALHVGVIGSLLRRWLLWPMEQLNRQVDALARDEPPGEPLLRSPREMANLAEALDRARISLGALRQQLIEAERLTTIGQFASQLAHNLRNPLASIRAAAQVAARHDPDDDYIRQRMEEIVASVDRLNRWIAGLMEVARRAPAPAERLDVMPVLNRVREAVATEFETKEMTLKVETPPDGLACVHDPDVLEHALVAMVLNAAEASPPGQTVLLRAETLTPENQTRPVCRITVVDRGSGLPDDAPERIFEFSYSTKQRGMGLGLALARQALQQQGGSVSAHNNPDGGATLCVELPLEPAGTEMANEK